MVGVLGPAVESPVDQTDLRQKSRRFILDDERRASVAQPAPIGRRLEESNRLEVDADSIKLVGHASFARSAADHDLNPFDPAQMADDLGVDPTDRRELAWPVVAIVRPGDPGRRMRLPFGRHAVTECGRCLHGHHESKQVRVDGPDQSWNRSVIGP